MDRKYGEAVELIGSYVAEADEMKEQQELQMGEVSRLREELRGWTEVRYSWRVGMTPHGAGLAGGTEDGCGGKDREATEDCAE